MATYKLNTKSIDKLLKDVETLQNGIDDKLERFCVEMARRGVLIAQNELQVVSAIDSGNLLNSIKLRRGEVAKYQCKYYIYTDCEYAKFVEFGTGVVGARNPHPDLSQANIDGGWTYDSHNHGEEGWVYEDENGNWHRTRGQASRPFMYNTKLKLEEIIEEVAREVFQ